MLKLHFILKGGSMVKQRRKNVGTICLLDDQEKYFWVLVGWVFLFGCFDSFFFNLETGLFRS